MRYMTIVKGPDNMGPPSQELIEAIGRLSEEMLEAGAMLDTGGLLPTATGARIRLVGDSLTITDGPFTEAKEVVGGYAILKASSKEEAIEMGRRFMEIHIGRMDPSIELELEIRPMFDGPEMGAGASGAYVEHQCGPVTADTANG
jgi:hypothetical protein